MVERIFRKVEEELTKGLVCWSSQRLYNSIVRAWLRSGTSAAALRASALYKICTTGPLGNDGKDMWA